MFSVAIPVSLEKDAKSARCRRAQAISISARFYSTCVGSFPTDGRLAPKAPMFLTTSNLSLPTSNFQLPASDYATEQQPSRRLIQALEELDQRSITIRYQADILPHMPATACLDCQRLASCGPLSSFRTAATRDGCERVRRESGQTTLRSDVRSSR